MKWKKVSEHPLPEGDGHRDFLLKLITNRIVAHEYPKKYPFTDLIIEWCEFNPDEIENADSKPIPPEFLTIDHHIHHSLEAKPEPSWEEKFRWETARKVMFDIVKGWRIRKKPSDQEERRTMFKDAVRTSDNLIAELKRGKE